MTQKLQSLFTTSNRRSDCEKNDVIRLIAKRPIKRPIMPSLAAGAKEEGFSKVIDHFFRYSCLHVNWIHAGFNVYRLA